MLSPFDPKKPPIVISKPPLRYIQPYFFIFQTHTKGRWLKKPLIQVLLSEFRAYTKQYYLKAIASQLLTINGKPTTPDTILKDNDLITHKTTRVQPPILDLPIKIIKQTNDLLVVQKPPGITIHSGGGFHYNTMMGRLFYQNNKKGIYLCHRLDKCTSGVIIFGKNKQISMKFHENNQKFVTKKMYYARVGGDFNQEMWKQVDKPIVCLDHKKGVYTVYEIEKHKELEQYHKHPIKESVTGFKKLWYDEETDSSLLQCYPKTGRTHQIRVHLQYTGHPILNDMVYGGRFVGNNVLRKQFPEDIYDKFMKQNEQNLENKLKDKQRQKQKEVSKQQKQQLNQNKGKRPFVMSEEEQLERKQSKKIAKLELGNYEKVIEPIQGQALEQQEWDYTNRAMQICLHSYKYTFWGVEYVTSKPYWYDKSLTPKYQIQQEHQKQQIIFNQHQKIEQKQEQLNKSQLQIGSKQ